MSGVFDRSVRAITRELEHARDRQHVRSYDVFSTFLTLGTAALDRMPDDAWQTLVGEWKPVLSHFVAAFGELVHAATHGYEDVLGPVYMGLAAGNARMGQFFTPWPVASCMAQMSLAGAEAKPDGEPLRILDPACGAGVMLLAAADALPAGLDAVYFGIDLDPLCCAMARLNLRVHGLRGQIECRNALAPLRHSDAAPRDAPPARALSSAPSGDEPRTPETGYCSQPPGGCIAPSREHFTAAPLQISLFGEPSDDGARSQSRVPGGKR